MELNWGSLLIQTIGGLAIFLYGMGIMTEGLKLVAGNRLRTFLAKMTSNKWKGMFAGASITAVIQSSSITTVLVVGFVSAGLLSFQNTLGIILGANIGTTITAQIIAFKVTKATFVLIAAGFLMNAMATRKALKDGGLIVLGLGFVFLGMNLMSEGTNPLRSYEPFIALMQDLDNPLWGILIGTAFTAAVQSSSATTGIVIVMASQGLINIEGGIALILGANIGTCVTAVLSAIGKPKVAQQVALSHILFNVFGALLWVWFIPQLSSLVDEFSPGDVPRQIANAHTIFNVSNALIFIGFTSYLAKLVEYLVPLEEKKKQKVGDLDAYFLNDSSTAFEMAHKELHKLGVMLIRMIDTAPNIVLTGDMKKLKQLRKRGHLIILGHSKIFEYLGELQKLNLNDDELDELQHQLNVAYAIEGAASTISSQLVEATENRLKKGFEMNDETSKLFLDLYGNLSLIAKVKLVDKTLEEKATIPTKAAFTKQMKQAQKHLVRQLVNESKDRVAIYRFETDLIETADRLYTLINKM
ncbi:Na/Pi cotransporter family protein [Saccharicrinis aurantiacus]|uniref:Na/Pi cotransporter family protein n=1 Tax=Saccharicrinis aurantiacus TaxID=1849719 RepID=UPI00095028AA|nr:Na/Pi cotransporter family protein [Saccharicrinis aurantiacus]